MSDASPAAGPIDRSRRLPLRTKLAFSAGSLEEAVVGAAGIATMLYYNQVLGLSASLCGVVFLIASVVLMPGLKIRARVFWILH